MSFGCRHLCALPLILMAVTSGCQGISDMFSEGMDTQSPRPVLGSPSIHGRHDAKPWILDSGNSHWNEELAAVRRDREKFYQTDKAGKSSLTDADRVVLRNQIQEREIELVDAFYEAYERELTRGKVFNDLVFDMTSLVLSGSATVTGGEQAKSVLSALAALSTGSKLAIDENVFFKQTAPALTAEMEALRAQAYKNLQTNRKGGASYQDYTLADAERDVELYYEAGTIPAAVAAISAAANQEKNNATQPANPSPAGGNGAAGGSGGGGAAGPTGRGAPTAPANP